MVDLRAPQGAPEPDPHHLDLAIWRLLPALVFAVQQDETAARATWGRSCARWTPASRPRRASEATVGTRSHWAGSKSGRYEHSGSGRQKVRLDDCRKRLLVLKVGAVLNFLGGWDRDGRLCPESHGAGGAVHSPPPRPNCTACATARSGRSGSGLPHFTLAGVTAGGLTGFEYLSIEWRHGHQRV